MASFEQIGISLSADQVSKFLTYYDLLVEKNKVMNLTAITSFEDVVRKHFVDSVLLICRSSFHNLFSDGGSVIDVGSGAGFPGIPLKIIFPKLQIVLLDSLNDNSRLFRTNLMRSDPV
ncbi:MAG: class I SAM-dependent methyltransferase, partial [Lachnospiraceae bacterium]|nr:class I SAM-dependent methyltransferase [Lachnospiraceae bacterium]